MGCLSGNVVVQKEMGAQMISISLFVNNHLGVHYLVSNEIIWGCIIFQIIIIWVWPGFATSLLKLAPSWLKLRNRKHLPFWQASGSLGFPGLKMDPKRLILMMNLYSWGRVRERQFWTLGGSQGRSWGLLGESLASPRSAFRGLLGHLGMT